MSLKLGSTSINALRLGSTEINKAYLGSGLVFDNTAPAGPPVLGNVTTARHLADGTINLPSGSGGVLVLMVWDFGEGSPPADGNVDTPAGFDLWSFGTQVSAHASGMQSRFYVFSRVANGSEDPTIALNYDTAFFAMACCGRITGADTSDIFGNDISVTQGPFSDTTRLMATLDAEVDNSLLLAMSISSETDLVAALTGMSEAANWGTLSNAHLFQQDIASAGAISAKSAAIAGDGADAWSTLALTIKPA